MNGIFIDCETGGLDPSVHALTQVAAVAFKVNPGEAPIILDTYNKLVKPSQWLAVSPGALDIQHRALDYLMQNGIEESIVYDELVSFIKETQFICADWAGQLCWAQEAAFDHSFCKALEKRVGNSDHFGDRCDWNCTKRLWILLRALGVHNNPRTSLKNIIAYYGLRGENEQTHDALDDAIMSVNALGCMLRDLAQVFKQGGK